jgi:hypothetical protein
MWPFPRGFYTTIHTCSSPLSPAYDILISGCRVILDLTVVVIDPTWRFICHDITFYVCSKLANLIPIRSKYFHVHCCQTVAQKLLRDKNLLLRQIHWTVPEIELQFIVFYIKNKVWSVESSFSFDGRFNLNIIFISIVQYRKLRKIQFS